MNDRFRFRAWDKSFRRMIYNIFFFWKENTITVHELHKDGSKSYLPNSHIVLEQCTGLLDKNGTPIFEGDIIFSNVKYGGTYFVIIGGVRGYCNDAVATEEYKEYFARGKDTGGGLSSTAYHIITDHGPCEVVGNIHENPELLEGGKCQ